MLYDGWSYYKKWINELKTARLSAGGSFCDHAIGDSINWCCWILKKFGLDYFVMTLLRDSFFELFGIIKNGLKKVLTVAVYACLS